MKTSDFDYLLPRIDSKRASFGYHIMRYFDVIGMKKPYSSEAILIAHNKFATIWELKKAGLPVPDTYYTASKESAEKILGKMDFPAVIKIVGGFGGKGVMFAESEETGKSVVRTLDMLKQELMIEKYVENPAVSVIVKSAESQKYYILGEIQKTGEYQITKRVTVLQAFALAGGFTEWASKKEIILLRVEKGKQRIIRINYKNIIKGKDLDQNVVVNPVKFII